MLSGFAWNPLGAAWLEAPGVVQLAELAGAQGISGVMVLAGGALWLTFDPGRVNRERLTGLAIAGLVMIGGLIGRGFEQEVYFPDNPQLIIVQPNIGQDEKYDSGANARHLATYLQMTRNALAGDDSVEVRGGAAAPAGEIDPVTGLRRPARPRLRWRRPWSRTIRSPTGWRAPGRWAMSGPIWSSGPSPPSSACPRKTRACARGWRRCWGQTTCCC